MLTSTQQPTRNAKRSRGFTLAELMAVVAIIGILATLASLGYRKYVEAAKASEAPSMINGIKAAQEAYRAETLTYLDVSGSLKTYYPELAPLPGQKVQWGGGSGPVAAKWRILNVTVAGPVYFVYATVAGGPSSTAIPNTDLEIDDKPTFAAPVEPWYLVQAKGDIDASGTGGGNSVCVGSSYTTDIYCEGMGK